MLASDLPHTRWIFPTAPVRPITINGGARMPGWQAAGRAGLLPPLGCAPRARRPATPPAPVARFDIASLDRIAAEQDSEGMRSRCCCIAQWSAAVQSSCQPLGAPPLWRWRPRFCPLPAFTALDGHTRACPPRSHAYIGSLVDKEMEAGVRRIVVGGFSQGGAMSLLALRRSVRRRRCQS